MRGFCRLGWWICRCSMPCILLRKNLLVLSYITRAVPKWFPHVTQTRWIAWGGSSQTSSNRLQCGIPCSSWSVCSTVRWQCCNRPRQRRYELLVVPACFHCSEWCYCLASALHLISKSLDLATICLRRSNRAAPPPKTVYLPDCEQKARDANCSAELMSEFLPLGLQRT